MSTPKEPAPKKTPKLNPRHVKSGRVVNLHKATYDVMKNGEWRKRLEQGL